MARLFSAALFPFAGPHCFALAIPFRSMPCLGPAMLLSAVPLPFRAHRSDTMPLLRTAPPCSSPATRCSARPFRCDSSAPQRRYMLFSASASLRKAQTCASSAMRPGRRLALQSHAIASLRCSNPFRRASRPIHSVVEQSLASQRCPCRLDSPRSGSCPC